jgi:ribonuclease BN (tRNA processing enzyme)
VEAILLGSGGWIPSPRRETCSALVSQGPDALLIDAGSGVSRLVHNPDLLAGVKRLDIVLTHFHLDHVVGLAYLPALQSEAELRVWAPGRLLYEATSKEILARIVGPPFFALGIDEVVQQVSEIEDGMTEVGAFDVRSRRQNLHSHPTLALRLGDRLAYCTDTAFDEENVPFASDVEVLAHEAWHASASTDDRTHTAAGDAGRLAARAGVGRLVLIHINPLATDEDALLEAAAREFATTAVGEDDLRIC